MIAFRICALVCTSIEQFSNKSVFMKAVSYCFHNTGSFFTPFQNEQNSMETAFHSGPA